nr:reverse transcriptase domain-containing protein [Tanacetum cinerariifolium]
MPDENPQAAPMAETQQEPWTLFTDGASCVDGSEEDGPTWMTPIVEYLKEGTLFSDRREARKLRIKARQYELMKGILYRRSFLTSWLRCVGPLQTGYVIREIHEGSCSMNVGPWSVVAKAIRLGYYWPTMHRDARDMIRKCNDCQIHHPITRSPQQPLTPITAPWPFYKWGIYIAGPFPEGPSKVKFLIIAMDYFTKWIEAKAVVTITGVKHPQSNGLVERENRSLGEGIKARLGLSRIYYLGDEVYPTFLHDDDRDMDLFSLIRAPNPTKVKTGSRLRAAHEVPVLTVTANRVIEMEDPAAATDSSREAAAPEMPPTENVTTTGVAPEAGQVEGVAATGPHVVKERRKRGHDGVDTNAPPKVLRRDHADLRPTESTRGRKSLAAIELGMGSTRPVPASQGAPVDVSDPDPLSFADPQSRPSVDVTQSSKGAAAARDPESGNTSFTSMVGSIESIYRPEWAKAIRLGYYWPTMHRDARDMIRKCNDCQIHHPITRSPQQPLTPITAPWPFYKWGIYIAGPFPEGPSKVKFLIIAMDYFTKWIEAKAVVTITGGQFSDNPFKDWCDELNITQRFVSVKHPQSNGLVERENRSLGEGIKARLAVIPTEIGMPTYRTAAVDVVSNDEELRLNLDLLEERRERAAICEAKAKLKMTKYYNARVRGVTFRPGD